MIFSLIGAGVSLPIGNILASFCKTISVIGHTTGALTLPAAAGATTYATSKVFTQHFASGGTLLNFNPEKVKHYYAEKLKQGREFVADLKY